MNSTETRFKIRVFEWKIICKKDTHTYTARVSESRRGTVCACVLGGERGFKKKKKRMAPSTFFSARSMQPPPRGENTHFYGFPPSSQHLACFPISSPAYFRKCRVEAVPPNPVRVGRPLAPPTFAMTGDASLNR